MKKLTHSESEIVKSVKANYAVSEKMKKNAYSQADGLPYFWRTTEQKEVDYLEFSEWLHWQSVMTPA